jgi:hypothetical protein
MRQFILGICSSVISTAALADGNLLCNFYVYAGVPFVSVSMTLEPTGRIAPAAQITHYGSTWNTTVKENPTHPNQLFNLVMDADKPGSELFIEIFKDTAPNSPSSHSAKFINPNSPVMKEMNGHCDAKS